MTVQVWQIAHLLRATKMLDHGFDATDTAVLLRAAWTAHDLGKRWSVEAKSPPRSTPSQDEEFTRSLLRTAEETTEFPCVSSGLLNGLGPTPVVITGEAQLSALRHGVAHAVMGGGKTWAALDQLMGQLDEDFHRVQRDGRRPTRAECERLTDTALTLSALLLAIVQRRLNDFVKHFVELVVVPLSGSSPCGLLRLAARRVPRAPGVGLLPGPSKFALVA